MEFKKLCFQYKSATFLKSSLSLCSPILFSGKVGTVIDKTSTVWHKNYTRARNEVRSTNIIAKFTKAVPKVL